MLDITAPRAEIVQHLEAALALCNEINDGVLGYLIERSLDEARAMQWTLTRPKKS